MINSTLPKLDDKEKGEIALTLISSDMVAGGNLLEKPNSTRREILARAKQLNIDPNKLLSLLHDTMKPNLEALFKPITPDEIKLWETEREERRKAKLNQYRTPENQ